MVCSICELCVGWEKCLDVMVVYICFIFCGVMCYGDVDFWFVVVFGCVFDLCVC